MSSAVNVRFDEETEARLNNVSTRFGVKSSMLIRNAVRAYLDSIEHSDSIVIHATVPASDKIGSIPKAPEASRLMLNESDSDDIPPVETVAKKVSYHEVTKRKKARKP